jgi:putative endonuclease
MEKRWFVYILQCSDQSLYTGITTDLTKRFNTHNAGKGAKYTRSRLPVKMVFAMEVFAVKKGGGRSWASKEEMRIKKMSRQKKLEMICPACEDKNYEDYLGHIYNRIICGHVCICWKK